jgi:hypothetical protein
MIRHAAPSRPAAISPIARDRPPGPAPSQIGIAACGSAGTLESLRMRAYVTCPKARERAKPDLLQQGEVAVMAIDEKTRTELEAAAFRRLVEHLRSRTDVQNIDMMNFAGFCRNCLSNWVKEAADQSGVPMTREESRQAIYGMPFEEWKAKYQNEASKAQLAAFTKSSQKH